MNSIQEALEIQSTTHLGPVLIDKDYGLNSKSKTPLRSIVISDASGKTILKLWGPAAKANIQEGDQIEVRALGNQGQITVQEYNGKLNLSANSCTVQVVGQGNAATQRAQARAATRPAAASSGAAKPSLCSMQELIDYGLAAVNYARSKGEQDGAVLGSIFGAAMYGNKEGRPFRKAAPAPAPAPRPALEPEFEHVGQDFPDQAFEEDDIPF